jgi:spermidine synthase
MKPFRTLAETHTPDGSRLTLHEHDGEYFMKLNGRQLMSTSSTASELLLTQKTSAGLARHGSPRVLIGGLGLGFSLKRALELVGPRGTVQVAELLGEVVAWNRDFLQGVNGALLDDARVEVLVADVFEVIRRSNNDSYDAILLDVDNGPTSFVHSKNSRIYNRRGLGSIFYALKLGGRVGFWSAVDEPEFPGKLARAGFNVEVFQAKAHDLAKQSLHRIYVGERRRLEPAHNRPSPA